MICHCGNDVPYSGYKFYLSCGEMKPTLTLDEEAEWTALSVMQRFMGLDESDWIRLRYLDAKKRGILPMYVVGYEVEDKAIVVVTTEPLNVTPAVTPEMVSTADRRGASFSPDGAVLLMKEGTWNKDEK